MVRMQVPENLWSVRLSEVRGEIRGHEKDLRQLLSYYCANIQKMIGQGYGFLLYGANGNGKTSAALVAAMEARRWGYTALFMAAAKLKEHVIQKTLFDDEQTVWERAHEVDVLVIDDVGKGSLDSKGFGERILDELIRARAARGKVTILTTNMTPDRLKKTETLKKSTFETLKECVLPVCVTGTDFRTEKREELVRAMMG